MPPPTPATKEDKKKKLKRSNKLINTNTAGQTILRELTAYAAHMQELCSQGIALINSCTFIK